MAEVDFTVTQTWDISSRRGLLVTGALTSGDINVGDVLQDATSGAPVRVIGIELHGFREPNIYTIVVDRDDAAHIHEGQRLVSATAPSARADDRSTHEQA